MSGRINRDFDRLKNFYGRVLDWTLARRPLIYTIWIGLTLLTIPMFRMAWQAKELGAGGRSGGHFRRRGNAAGLDD